MWRQTVGQQPAPFTYHDDTGASPGCVGGRLAKPSQPKGVSQQKLRHANDSLDDHPGSQGPHDELFLQREIHQHQIEHQQEGQARSI
jgi:hypothetical protein